MNRNLDGFFYRIMRDGKFHNICLSDMTEEERDEVIQKYDKQALRYIVHELCRRMRAIGDYFKIVHDDGKDE